MQPYKKADLRLIWRWMFALGAIPPIAILRGRMNMKETAMFEKAQQRDTAPKLCTVLCMYGRELSGTAGCWFLNDIMFYGIGIWSSSLLMDLQEGEKGNLYAVMIQGLVIASCALPWHLVCPVDGMLGSRPEPGAL